MNKLEQRYDLLLRAKRQAGEIHCYRFEAIRLRLADNTTYTPDFCVLLPDGLIEFHETKGGLVRDDARVKFKVAAEQYPEFRFIWAQEKRGTWTITTA